MRASDMITTKKCEQGGKGESRDYVLDENHKKAQVAPWEFAYLPSKGTSEKYLHRIGATRSVERGSG